MQFRSLATLESYIPSSSPTLEISLENQDNHPSFDDCSFARGGWLGSSFQSTGGVSPGSWERVDRSLPVLKAAKGRPFSIHPVFLGGGGGQKSPASVGPPILLSFVRRRRGTLFCRIGNRGASVIPWRREKKCVLFVCCSCAELVLRFTRAVGCFCGWMLSRYFGVRYRGSVKYDDEGSFFFFFFFLEKYYTLNLF